MGKKGKKASQRLGVHGCGVMNLRLIEEAVPNDRRHDALFAATPELIALLSSVSASDAVRLRAVASLADQLRHRTVESINRLLLACGDDGDKDEALETHLMITELEALAQLAADGVKAAAEETQEDEDEDEQQEESERRLLASMRSACGHVESLFAQTHAAYAASTLGVAAGTYEHLAAQVVSQLVGVVDSIVSAGGLMRASNTDSLLHCNDDDDDHQLVGLHAHLACAVDAQLHLLSALVRVDGGGAIQAELLRDRAPGVEFLAATLEHELRVLLEHERKASEPSGGSKKSSSSRARQRFEALCRQAVDVAQRLRRSRSIDGEQRQEDLDELNRLGFTLAAAVEESRKLAALANHVTAANPLPGSGPATPKLPREEPDAGWAEVGGGATVEPIILPAVIATSRFHAAMAAHRLSTSHQALRLRLSTDKAQTSAGDAPLATIHQLWAKLRRLFRRCGTLSTLARGIIVDRLHHHQQQQQQKLQQRRALCGVVAADIMRQQAYAAVFEINKLSLVLHTASSALDAVWPMTTTGISGLGAHDRACKETVVRGAGETDAALAREGEELARRIAVRLGRFEAQVARALPPATTAEQRQVTDVILAAETLRS